MASGYRCVRNEYRCDANSGEVDSTGFDGGGQLLPLDYDELRKLAAARLAHEKPGQTLQATALVHEAYLRLAGGAQAGKTWDGRGHFFAAAAEAMPRILVDAARRKQRLRHGGDLERDELDDDLEIAAPEFREDLLALDAALDKLKQVDGTAAELVVRQLWIDELCDFAG